jgi:hypothetical protein
MVAKIAFQLYGLEMVSDDDDNTNHRSTVTTISDKSICSQDLFGCSSCQKHKSLFFIVKWHSHSSKKMCSNYAEEIVLFLKDMHKDTHFIFDEHEQFPHLHLLAL